MKWTADESLKAARKHAWRTLPVRKRLCLWIGMISVAALALWRWFSAAHPLSLVGIAWLPAMLAASALVHVGESHFSRRTKRLLASKCPTCGYDLRATPDRCPECGTTPKTFTA